MNSAVDNMADVQVSRPDRVDLAVKDSQPHLGAIAKESCPVAVARRLVVCLRSDDYGFPRDRINSGVCGIGIRLSAECLPPVDARG